MSSCWADATGRTITIGSAVEWWPRPRVAYTARITATDPATGHPVITARTHYGLTMHTVDPATLRAADTTGHR